MSAHLTPATSFVLIALTLLPGLTLGADPVVPLTLEEPLLSYHNSVGNLDGVSVELVRELQRRVGNEKPIQVYPWARAYRIAQTRADTLLFTTTRSAEREPLFHWLLRVNRDAWMLFARHDDGLQLNSLEGAKRVESVGVLRGGAHALLLRSEGFTNLVPMASYAQLLENLTKGRIRLGLHSASGFIESASRAGIPTTEIKPLYTLRTSESYLVLSKPGTDPDTVRRWQEAAASMLEDGSYERIARHWVDRLRREQGFKAHYRDGALNLWPDQD
ncbi:MAG: ABC transporter substrate-binding protein [Motiliproteus sp.]